MPRPSEEQWRAARLAADGAPMTRARIAGMLGVDVGAVYLRAVGIGHELASLEPASQTHPF